jgi:hypothetical protein
VSVPKISRIRKPLRNHSKLNNFRNAMCSYYRLLPIKSFRVIPKKRQFAKVLQFGISTENFEKSNDVNPKITF